MSDYIGLNSQTHIDLPTLIDSRLLVQANSGGGKSWLLRRLLEQSHGKVQQIVLDPEGEFSTLREKYDYILAGKDGDTPAEPRSAALLARKLLELNVSAIVDLYELSPQVRKHFVRLFLEAMVNAPKNLWHPVIVVIDEAHVFVPEKDQSEAAGAVIDLATRGRKRGFCAILATQRISKLAKDASSELNNKLIGRASQDVDMKRAAYELGFTTAQQTIALRSLKPGEFYAFGPAISDDVQKITVGNVQTTHPKAGSRSLTKVIPPTPGIKKLLGKLADLPQEAEKEAQTKAEFKAEITRLKRELSIAKRANPAPPALKVQKIEVPAIGKRSLEFMVKAEKAMRKLLKDARTAFAASEANVTRFEEGLDKLTAQIEKTITHKSAKLEPPKILGLPVSIDPKQPNNRITLRGPKNSVDIEIGQLTGPEQRILNAVAWMESIGVSEPQQTAVAFLAGYTYGGGGFNNPRGSLRTKGLVEYRGDRIALTDAGREYAQIPETPLTTEALHGKVLSILPGPERKLLTPLLEAYPNEISNEELAERSGYTFGSGGFNNPRGRLRSLGLIEYLPGGKVKAKSLLFINP